MRISRFAVACVLALGIFAAAYANSLENAFHFDDRHVVEENLFIRDLANAPRFFTDARTFSSLPQNAVYRPVVSLSVAVDYALGGGLVPTQFHRTQLALLALVAVLLAFLYLRLFDTTGEAAWHRWAALFAATLFAVHTANSQVGNYISARSESLSALGVLLAFFVYLRAPAARKYHLFLIPVALGALAKNHAVTFAPLLLAYKLLIEQQLSLRELATPRARPRARRAIVESIPTFVVCVLLVLLIERMAPAGQHYGGGERLPYLATQAWVWVRYVALYFVPIGLTADTDLKPFATLTDPRTFAGLALAIGSLVTIARASRSARWRPVAFGLAWFWITLAPTSSVIPLAEVTNDHRAFLPYVGLNAAVVWAAWVFAQRLLGAGAARERRRVVAVGFAVALLVALSAATFQRNKVWRTDETLWADVARKSPANGRGLMNYGLALMARGQLVEARDLFLRAQRLLPQYSYVETNLGVVNAALKDPRAAERHFRRSLELDDTQPSHFYFFARFLVTDGKAPEAIALLTRAIEISPGRTESRHLLLGIYAARGATRELATLARETLAIDGADRVALSYAAGTPPFVAARDDYDSWFALGVMHTRGEFHLEAAQAYRMALARDNAQADAWSNLGWSLGKLGFFAEAIPALERALQLKPGHTLARNNLAWARTELGRPRVP